MKLLILVKEYLCVFIWFLILHSRNLLTRNKITSKGADSFSKKKIRLPWYILPMPLNVLQNFFHHYIFYRHLMIILLLFYLQQKDRWEYSTIFFKTQKTICISYEKKIKKKKTTIILSYTKILVQRLIIINIKGSKRNNLLSLLRTIGRRSVLSFVWCVFCNSFLLRPCNAMPDCRCNTLKDVKNVGEYEGTL